jgi:hypothetical protein
LKKPNPKKNFQIQTVMKTINQFSIKIFFVLLMMFLLKPQSVFSQTFPLPGATWVFKANNPPWLDDLAQMWEYEGDSIVVGGIIKKMKITVKQRNPAWYPYDTTITNDIYKYFLPEFD